MKRPLLFGSLALFAGLVIELPAFAQDPRPVVVEYLAPLPECASADAFQRLLQAEVARWPNERRLWRFSVRVRRGERGGFEGTLTSERGPRTVTAGTCDALTSAVAVLIARDEVEPPAPTPPPEPPPPAEPEPPVLEYPTTAHELPATPRREGPSAEWRIGVRADVSNHGVNGAAVAGGMGVLSLEVRGGLDKMMFELAAGSTSSTDNANPLRYYILDAQACLLDVPLVSESLRFLGCLRLAGASFSSAGYEPGAGYLQGGGGALWTGAGARLRWQTGLGVYVEGSVNGVYGTVSGGESTSPGWVDAALSVGFRL